MEINAITKIIIGSAQTVSNTLGCGFLEKVYENALAHEIQKQGLHTEQQYHIPIFYDGEPVGDYTVDLIVEHTILVELKCVTTFDPVHIAQCLIYLLAANLPLCLLINFYRPRLEVRRILNKYFITPE